MACRIKRVGDGKNLVAIRVSGRIQHVETLQALFAQERRKVALDPGDVTLVDWEVLKFPAFCDGSGVDLKDAPDYLSDWVRKEASGNR